MNENVDAMSDEDFEQYMSNAVANEIANEEAIVDEPAQEAEEEQEQEEHTEDQEEELEQPVTDSGETTDDDETGEEEPKETTETATETDGSAEEVTEDNPEEKDKPQVTSEDDAQLTKSQLHRLKASGGEFEVDMDELKALAAKGIDYTKKTQEIAPWRTAISKLKEAELNETDIDMMIDVLKGNKEATTALLKRTGVDALELDMEKEQAYTPNIYGKSDVELDIQEAFSEIDRDLEASITRNVISNVWDEASRDKIVSGITLGNGKALTSQDILRGLHVDVKSGKYNEVAPVMMKMKALDGGRKSDIEYYMDAGTQVEHQRNIAAQAEANNARAAQEAEKAKQAEAEKVAEAKALADKLAANKAAATKRKAAAPTKSRAGTSDVIDYLDADAMSDEEFSAMMDKQLK